MDSPKILVVEDENVVALELKKKTSRDLVIKCQVLQSQEKKLSAKAEGFLPDLVIMDIRLKGDIDGIQAAKAHTRG
ncbi:MAG: hypothetical protein R2741_02680 [Methanolobus sp.]